MSSPFRHFCSEPPHLSAPPTPRIMEGFAPEMAVQDRRCWPLGSTLRIAFLGGSPRIHKLIAKHARTWTKYANIRFDFRPRKEPADIRIAFNRDGGTWSCVGTEARSIAKEEPTMNFSDIVKERKEAEIRWVVLHEFGHALGCVHEHQRPDNGIPWKKMKLYAYYKRTNNWSRAEVKSQVLDKYDLNDLRNGSFFDPESIMIYAVPEYFTKGPFRVDWNYELSEEDKRFIGKMYPGR